MKINYRQRTILQICFGVIVVMTLFPPFITKLPNGVQSSDGFGFLFWPPKGHWEIRPTVNAIQLIVQWLGICLLGGIGYLLSGQLPQEKNSATSGQKVIFGLKADSWVKLSGPILRIVRGMLVLWVVVIGIAFMTSLFQAFTTDPASSGQLDWGVVWALLIAKVIGIAIILVINRGLGAAINRIYRTHFGRTSDVVVSWRNL